MTDLTVRDPFTENEKAVIRAFAAGEIERRDEAISIFRLTLRRHGTTARGNPYFDFMSETDSPVACYIIKSQSRAKILGRPWP